MPDPVTTPLSERFESRHIRDEYLAPGTQVLRIYAEGMPKFQLDNATQEITPRRIIREVLRWVEGTHVPSITYRSDRNAR